MNPILNKLNLNRTEQINNVLGMLQGKNPDIVYNQLLKSNPRFAQFVKDNQGKSPEQIAQEYGIDFNLIKPFMK